MVEHMLRGFARRDGFDVAVCSCGAKSPPSPGTAEAANFWGQHLLAEAAGDRSEDTPDADRLEPDLSGGGIVAGLNGGEIVRIHPPEVRQVNGRWEWRVRWTICPWLTPPGTPVEEQPVEHGGRTLWRWLAVWQARRTWRRASKVARQQQEGHEADWVEVEPPGGGL